MEGQKISMEPILTNIDEILDANPLKEGEEFQVIEIAQDDSVSFRLVRSTVGHQLNPHFHKGHTEIILVVKGSGQTLVKGKWISIRPGTVHYNPAKKIHSIQNTGTEPLVTLTIFTPALKEPDRIFVE